MIVLRVKGVYAISIDEKMERFLDSVFPIFY